MAAGSTADQASSLLERRVAEARRQGALSTEAETLALFESIAFNLLLQPRSALLFAFLAKNGLRKAVQDELTSVSELLSVVRDLSNVSFSVNSTTSLQKARVALLQMEQLTRVSVSDPQFKKFDSSVSEFLTKSLGKSLRRPHATSLTRPGSEAAVDLTPSFESLKTLHSDFLDRLYDLVVGVENFLESPLSSIIGLTTVARVRADVDSLISTIEETGSAPANRDMAIRLITDRASLKVIGDFPTLSTPVIGPSSPKGYSIQAESDLTTASALSAVGPFVMGAAPVVSVTVNGTTVAPTNFPQSTFDLQNRAVVIGRVPFTSVTLPADFFIRGTVDGVSFSIPIPSGIHNVASIASIFSGVASGFPAPISTLSADSYVVPASNLLLFHHPTASSISITEATVTTATISPVPTPPALATYPVVVPTDLLKVSGAGQSGSTSPSFISDGFKYLCGTLVNSFVTQDGKVKLETLSSALGTSLTVAAPAVLGIAGTTYATSDSIRLIGSVLGVATDPINPIGLVDIGDQVSFNNVIATLVGITNDRMRLSAQVRTARAAITVESALYLAYQNFIGALSAYVTDFSITKFASDLAALELPLSSLREGVTQSQRNEVIDLLNTLTASLSSLLIIIDAIPPLDPRSASQEREIVGGIISSLEERKFDKAVDFFLRCKIQEALDSDFETASYGGSFLKASAEFARADIKVPNRALDEEVEGIASQEETGL